ncbi:hypothetical protein AB3K78_07070 [Leucobacter sp. HNU]|uniref:hypothetical protein n=1 Tax=Leucobacter sp. HNU TaxID=3236805 RepID=UPI003A802EC0
MSRNYQRKSGHRKYEERSFSVRAVHRDPVDLHLLAQVLIRRTLQHSGESRAARRAIEPPDTFREPAGSTVSVAESGRER